MVSGLYLMFASGDSESIACKRGDVASEPHTWELFRNVGEGLMNCASSALF